MQSGFVNAVNIFSKFKYVAAVTPFVVIPGDKLDESIGESNARFGVKDWSVGITEEVAAESTMKDSEILGLAAMEEYLDRVDISKPADIVWER